MSPARSNILGGVFGLERKHFELLYEAELATATTTWNITGFDGDNEEQYIILGDIQNDSGLLTAYRLRFNADGANNYDFQLLMASNAVITASRANVDGYIIGAANVGQKDNFVGFIVSGKSGVRRTGTVIQGREISATQITSVVVTANQWRNSADPITQMNLHSTQVDGIGVGTRIQIFGLKDLI